MLCMYSLSILFSCQFLFHDYVGNFYLVILTNNIQVVGHYIEQKKKELKHLWYIY